MRKVQAGALNEPIERKEFGRNEILYISTWLRTLGSVKL